MKPGLTIFISSKSSNLSNSFFKYSAISIGFFEKILLEINAIFELKSPKASLLGFSTIKDEESKSDFLTSS